jgi:glycosyltransferase involved in cell wall biosynthesis
MRILHVIPSLAMGGAEHVTVNLAAAQKALGNEVSICCVMTPPEKGHLYNTTRELGIRCYYSYSKHEPRIGPTVRLARLMRQLAPNVVQSHLPRTNSCSAVAARLAGIRCVIATFHDAIIWANKRQRKWGRWAVHLQDALFCDSAHIRGRLIESCPSAARKARLVFPGVPVRERIHSEEEKKEFRQQWGIGENDPLVGIVARLAAVKDHSTFIEAAEIVIRAHPRVKFLVVGDGATKEQIRRRVAEKALEKSILIIGFVPSPDLVLSMLDIFVLTSSSEGLPISILEALMAGLPVVATNIGGISEIVRPGENGFLVEPRQPAEVAGKIQAILGDSILIEKMQKNARETAENYRIEKIAQRAIDYYREVSR